MPDVHVLPIDDLREHVESVECWCEPRIEGEGPSFVIVHHSADKREFREAQDA